MKGIRLLLAIGAVLAWPGMALTAAPDAPAVSPECLDIPVVISGGEPASRALACEGAQQAIGFLREHGLETDSTVHIALRANLPGPRDRYVGLYDTRIDLVYLLPFAESMIAGEHCGTFKVVMDEDLYRSFAAHEVAHAVASKLPDQNTGRTLAQEYLAYATQLSVMPGDVRNKVLAAFPVSAFSGPQEISLVYYQMAPGAFGVKAYLHFRNQQDRPGFLRKLLSGQVPLDEDQPEWW